MTNFLVVKSPSSYNAIIGCPTLNNLKAITSTYHLKVKFLAEVGVSKIRDEQTLAQECYVQELKTRTPTICITSSPEGCPPLPPPLPTPLISKEPDVEARNEKDLLQVEVNESLKIVQLHPNCPIAITRVSTNLPPEYREALKQLLMEHRDVFACSYEDMPAIDNLINEHSLCINLEAKKVWYNQIRMNKTDEEKMAFITDRGLYCYRVMHFGLKNAGETYQRQVNRMLKH
ncbi:uncharacterized protein LOC121236339 [Juglans microcarpa x Juglans regia]|uniref:uncharacterized protein LOC121236339 n=1 Tax=Juglans microcarpa x Juglans regia TaxID=2249226 RepID=UPI001B7D915E|nr:uncharacterized protein LOC121236339 [Juglans microcarpa x Juglans regia]